MPSKSNALHSMQTGAVKARAGLRNKPRVFFRELREDEIRDYFVLDPLIKVANREQDAFRLVAVALLLLIAGVEGFELLIRSESGRNKSVANADHFFGKGLGDLDGSFVSLRRAAKYTGVFRTWC